MNISDFLEYATKRLKKAGIGTARLDCLVVLEDLLSQDRATLLAHPEMELPTQKLSLLNNFITQRENHLPLAYYRGKAAFYGHNFAVNKHVLVPRPESESIIELLKKSSLPAPPRIADIGSGSGCLGITAVLEIPDAHIFLYDNDPAALEVAKRNVTAHKVQTRAQVTHQDLLTDCHEHFDVILANLPYIPETHPINQAATYEPKHALYSGHDGLDHYRRFWKQVAMRDRRPTYIIIESMPEQHQTLQTLAAATEYIAETTDGYALSLRKQRQA